MSSDDKTLDTSARHAPAGSGPDARRVGPYRLEGELGRGGMGVVYRAFDERLHREVALKALPDELARDAERLARLEREARSLAAVSHPNVASIFGMEEAEGVTYLVLELVPGRTLHERLDGGPLSPDEALALCGQVAAGLEAVHRKGLVHRDLKPSNVMVTPEGTAKLLDFGLARRAREETGGSITRRDQVLGTPGWMSPEQLRGEVLDARSDVFAWGCLLYECLTGTPAFPGASWAERDAAVLTQEPDWGQLPELSQERHELLRACLSKDRAGRPATLEQVRRASSPTGSGSSVSRGGRRHSLPVERDAFVGRAAELRELDEQVAASRLVSVLGLGGTGKTRLVGRFAREHVEDFPGGAWFCDLSEARSAEGIAHAVATALDVPLGQDDPVERLGHAIAGRGACLVVLDNFEQVARHAEQTLGRWLERCEQARFVVTTREVLGLREERSLALAPLDARDAVELFTARAQQRGRAPGPDDAETIAELVNLLDRLPLAVELAAARTRVLSPQQLLERMGDRFRLLAEGGGRRDRQATLRATLDWSWELLCDWEQAALAQASVFEGGFTLEAAEAVLDLAGHADAPWAMDAVQSLVEKSLVHRTGDDRFDLLVSVQEYAAEKLRARGPEAEASARERHGAHFAGFGAEPALAALSVHGGHARRRALARELDNLVAACRRAVARADEGTAVAALAAAWEVLLLRGPNAAAVELAEAVRRVAKTPALRARTEGLLGQPLTRLGRMDDALACQEASLAIARELGDREHEAMTLLQLGQVHGMAGRTDEGAELFETALAIHRELGNRSGEARALGLMGLTRTQQGRRDEGRACYESALALFRELGDLRGQNSVFINLGALAQEQQRLDDASASFEAGLPIARELGDRQMEGLLRGNLGIVRLGQGRLEEARALLEEAMAIDRETGYRHNEAFWLRGLAQREWSAGRPAEAVSRLEQALAADPNPHRQAVVFTELVVCRLACGDPAGARRALESGEACAPASMETQAALRMARARLLAAEGDADAAEAAFSEAAKLVERFGAGPDSAVARELEQLRAVIDGGGTEPPPSG